MLYFQLSSSQCCSLQSIGLSLILGRGLRFSALPQAQPPWLGPAARHAWGAWTPLITNSSSQASGLPSPTQAFTHHKQTSCSYSRRFFFSFFLHSSTLQVHRIHFLFLFYSILYSKWERGGKWRKWRVPFFLWFSILSHFSFSCSSTVAQPRSVCADVCACLWVCVLHPSWTSA